MAKHVGKVQWDKQDRAIVLALSSQRLARQTDFAE